MTFSSAWLRLSDFERLLTIYACVFLAWAVYETFTSPPDQSRHDYETPHIGLSDRALGRLEDGESITIDRWHGDPLEIAPVEETDTEE